ncbi:MULTISPECIES: hypothetical protein [unclassified Paenibacillus]|uniref:hypothetical protein n=1 Tax=unclassified Paenibacillus TaxID=185978 RepID=UPI001160B46D|nr:MULTISPECIES: hypothetical protein [unclassified Paenibacillus]
MNPRTATSTSGALREVQRFSQKSRANLAQWRTSMNGQVARMTSATVSSFGRLRKSAVASSSGLTALARGRAAGPALVGAAVISPQLLARVRGAGAALAPAALNQAAQAGKGANAPAAAQSKAGSMLMNGLGQARDFLNNLQKSAEGIKNKFLDMAKSAITGAAEQDDLRSLFVARTGREDVGGAMYDKFKGDALQKGINVKEFLSGTIAAFSTTQNTDHLDKINELAYQLKAASPNGSFEKAQTAIVSALKGDTKGLEGFMAGSDLAALKLGDKGKKNDFQGFFTALEQAMNENGMGANAGEVMQKTVSAQWNELQGRYQSALAGAGQQALEASRPILESLNQAFETGKFTPFFQALSMALYGLASVAGAAASFIQTHLDKIKLVLIGVGAVLAVLAAMWIANWAAALWPVLLVIAVIALLMEVFHQMGFSTQEVVGFVIGIFMGLYAFLQNIVAALWNLLLSFAEFLGNLWYDPVYAGRKLFYDLSVFVWEMVASVINGITEMVNAGTQLINKLTGSKIGLIPELDMDNIKDMMIEPVAVNQKVDLSAMKMKQVDVGSYFVKGQDWTNQMFKAGAEFKSSMDKDKLLEDWNQSAKIKRIDEVGKIKENVSVGGEVDIANEDLKLMRELADIRSIQNFVTLTPTVQVETGDIRSSSDVDELVRKITSSLQQEFVRTAGGVYA